MSSQSYGFSSSHVWMWELDHKVGRAWRNWCLQTVALEKTLKSPLNSKEIKPVNPKGNQSWIFTGRTDAETPILWPPVVLLKEHRCGVWLLAAQKPIHRPGCGEESLLYFRCWQLGGGGWGWGGWQTYVQRPTPPTWQVGGEGFYRVEGWGPGYMQKLHSHVYPPGVLVSVRQLTGYGSYHCLQTFKNKRSLTMPNDYIIII